jgi:hypothetical protein
VLVATTRVDLRGNFNRLYSLGVEQLLERAFDRAPTVGAIGSRCFTSTRWHGGSLFRKLLVARFVRWRPASCAIAAVERTSELGAQTAGRNPSQISTAVSRILKDWLIHVRIHIRQSACKFAPREPSFI